MINRKVSDPYFIRDIPIYGFTSIQQFVDFLLPGEDVYQGMLVAVNAEKVLVAENNPQLREILLSGELNYPDGISIVRSIRKKYPASRVVRTSGADLWLALMRRSGQQHLPVYLVGGQPSVLQETSAKLSGEYQVRIVGMQDGYFNQVQTEQVIRSVAASGARLVTVAMGSPRQELFIRHCQQYYPQALYMGVGGTYDVFTGRVKRAPLLWQRLGLEWLYRLIHQPSRLCRQLKLLRYQKYHWHGDL